MPCGPDDRFLVDFQLNIDSETIGHLYVSEPLCVDPSISVRDVLRQLQQHNRGCVLVVSDERLQGIFTERDALHRMASGEGLDEPVARAMAAQPVTVTIDDSVADAIEKMSVGGYRRLPVVDDQGRPRGVLKVSAILHFLVEHFPKVIYTLPPEPHHFPPDREGA